MTLKLLLSIQMICKMFIKNIKDTIQVRNKVLIVLDDMIADKINNLILKKLNPIVNELFTRGRKLNILIVFITIIL